MHYNICNTVPYGVRLRITIHRQACYMVLCAKNNDESIGLPGRSYEIIESSETFRASRQYFSTLVRNFCTAKFFLHERSLGVTQLPTNLSRPVRNWCKVRTQRHFWVMLLLEMQTKISEDLWVKLWKDVLRDSWNIKEISIQETSSKSLGTSIFVVKANNKNDCTILNVGHSKLNQFYWETFALD